MNIYKRGFKITKNLIGKDISIHNGQKFISILVTKYMVGHKFGEFSFTRYVGYKNKELLKTKQKKR